MIIVLMVFFHIYTIHCQIITLPTILSNCSFYDQIYLQNSAVFDQIQFINSTSIILTANYAFLPSVSSFELGLIYQFSQSNFLVPFPIIFTCATLIHSCQLTTITSRDFEPIRVQLTSFNYTKSSTSQMGLYLKQGRYQLSNCSLNHGQQMTDPKTVFSIQIQYEKPVGK